jgi:hypothetical protein
MSREIGSFAPNVAAWSKDFEDASSKFQRMAALVKDLDQRLQDVTAELNNEVETRKNWMKRANAAETRQVSLLSRNPFTLGLADIVQKQQQFILMLLDGNQSFFKPDIVRGGESSAQSAVHSLIAEIREAAESKHKSDLASDIQVVVHLFIDFGRLIRDLVSAGSLSDGQQLQDFTAALTASSGLLSVTDCGSGREGIDGKMKGQRRSDSCLLRC